MRSAIALDLVTQMPSSFQQVPMRMKPLGKTLILRAHFMYLIYPLSKVFRAEVASGISDPSLAGDSLHRFFDQHFRLTEGWVLLALLRPYTN
jgi:hypothetical protein